MSQKAYFKTAAFIFLVIAALHLLRLVLGWQAVFEGWIVPQWLSAIALVIAGYLAYEGFRLNRR